MKKIHPVCILLAFFSSCQKFNAQRALNTHDISKVIHQMTVVMTHDVTNPPLAARFFAYTCLAGYEIVAENNQHIRPMTGILNQYPVIQKPKGIKNYNYELSAILAMYQTAEKLQPSGSTLMAKNEAAFVDSCRLKGYEEAEIDSSKRYAQVISKQILAYAKADKYNRTSNYRRYTPKGTPGSWDPTPPVYMSPVEPYFNTIRPLTLDSAAQFVPDAPIPFSTEKHSAFYKYLLLSYTKAGNKLTQEQKNTANFWDCNPFAVQNNGHMLVGLKKISPGAHWMGITDISCELTHTEFSKAIEINTMVSVGLLDCFICCWEDKYRTNRIRPETAIREYIDPNWKPWLQTPPFPEYISGHSVVSATSSVILTHYFGNHFAYTDNVEKDFGIPARHFDSFQQAANQAAISRFWGGIHFMDAINNGLKQGQLVGNWVLSKINNSKAR
jgi:hypothetical protein